MTDQDPELRQLLATARGGMSPTADDAEHVHTRLSTALALPVDPEHPREVNPSVGTRALRATRLRWLALGLSVGGLAGYALGQRPLLHSGRASPSAGSAETSAPPQAPDPGPAAPPAATLPAAEESLHQAPNSARAVKSDAGWPAPGSRGHEPREPAPQDEVALLQRVNRALARGEAAWALTLLQQLDHEVPRGRLLEERAAGGAIARCMLDPRVGAWELARYTKLYPSSVHLARVSQVCTPPAPG